MIGCSIFFGNVVTASADVSDAKPPNTVVEEKQQDLDADTEKADVAEENVSVTQGAEPEKSAETEEAPELSEAEAPENGESVSAPAGIAPMAREVQPNDASPQVTGGEISLVRGVEKTGRFYYQDPQNVVKHAGFVDGGGQIEAAFKDKVEFILGEENGSKYVDVKFKLDDDFANGNFPKQNDPGIWTKYIALSGDDNQHGKKLNDVGFSTHLSKLAITVQTQKTAEEDGVFAIEADRSLLRAEVDKETTVKGSSDYTKADADKKEAYDTALAAS